MMTMFPMAEVAFWYYFLIGFDENKGNNRYFKDWIMPKEKLPFVIKAVETVLGTSHPLFLKRAAKYGLK